MKLSDTFAARLGAELSKKGLTQAAFSERAGVTRSYVNQLLKGYTSPKLETVERYAEVLGVPSWALLVDLDAPEFRGVMHAIQAAGPSDQELTRVILALSGLSRQRRALILAALNGMLENAHTPG